MAYPAGVQTVTLRLGSSFDSAGTLAKIEGNVVPQFGAGADHLVWTATGQTYAKVRTNLAWDDAEKVALATVPLPSQAGWRDQTQASFVGWSYQINAAAVYASGERQSFERTVTPQPGDTVIDVDLLPNGVAATPAVVAEWETTRAAALAALEAAEMGGADPQAIADAVADYLTANPPAGGGLDTEGVQDIVGAMATGAGGTYDDAAGTITLPSGGDSVSSVAGRIGDVVLSSADLTDVDTLATADELSAGLDTKANVSHAHGVTDLTATGTRDATTYLRGDNTWATPAGGGTRSVVPQLSAIGTKLLTGQSVTLGVASDSTADMVPNSGAVVEWPRRLCDAIAAARPSARVQLHNWSDATQTYAAPIVVQAGDATSALLINDGFGRASANLIGSTADTVAGVWAGSGTPTADGSVAALPPMAALSFATTQQASSVTATLKVVTQAAATQQLRLAVAMSNASLSGYGVYAMLQINTGGTQHYLGIKKTTPSGSNVDVVPLALQSLGLVNNSPTAQDATMTLDLTGTTVTLTVTVGATTTSISGTVPQADLDTMGFHAGALGWAGTTAFRLDRLEVALPAADGQTVDVYNGSHAGSVISYQGTRAAAMYGSGVTGTIDALIVASGINNTAATPVGYSSLMAANVALIEEQQPAAGIVLASQNPLHPPVSASEIVRHGDRTAALRGLAAANGWGYLPVFEAFTLTEGTLTSDGTHPNDAGSALWADVAWGAMALIAPDASAHEHDFVRTVNGIAPDGAGNVLVAGGLTGTGMPNGVVTANPGTYYTDTAGTNGAWQWLKTSGTGNTGWTVIYGDTGWRAVASTFLATGSYRIRRIGQSVFFGCGAGAYLLFTFSTSAATHTHTGAIPVGFRPTGTEFTTIRLDSGKTAAGIFEVQSAGVVVARLSPASVADMQTEALLFPTEDAWPTTLPGSPA